MADYGGLGGGRSFRDALSALAPTLNQLSPMTGLGNITAGFPPQMTFPPQVGSPQPSGPVPLPQPRPPGAPGGMTGGPLAQGALGPGGLGAVNPQFAPGGRFADFQRPRGQFGIEGSPRRPFMGGRVDFPLGDNLMATLRAQYGGPRDFGGMAGLTRQF